MLKAISSQFSKAPGNLELLSLWSLAVCQPLYDVLAKQPTFLSAHALQGLDLVLYVCVVSALLPVGIFLVLALVKRVAPKVNAPLRWLTACVLITLLSFFLVGTLLEAENSLAVSSLAFMLAAFAVLMVAKFARVREGVRLASCLGLIAPLVLLYSLPSGYLSGREAPPPMELTWLQDKPDRLPDVVMLVFDELPLTALLNDQLQIRSDLFPNLATLAAESDWYVQASTVASRTRLAVPALLTGKRPVAALGPEITNHPQNLFTILASVYALNVDEPATRLCVQSECSGSDSVDWVLSAVDTAVVYSHLVAPRYVANRLPPLTAQWSGFISAPSGVHDKRLARFENWLTRFPNSGEPGLNFLHSLLPHIPYSTLPNTNRLFRHGPMSGHITQDRRDELAPEPWADVEARHFFLWQLQLVDRMVGKVRKQLLDAGRYDDTLFIVTSDHGVRLVPGKSRRQPVVDDFVDIAAVPLFIKRPQVEGQGSTGASRIEQPLQSIDVLPIILTAIGIDPVSLGLSDADFRARPIQRRIRSYKEYISLPAMLDLGSGQRWWPESEVVPPSVKIPVGLPECATTIELRHPEFYQHTYPEHFLAAHVLIDDPQMQQTKVLVEFNGEVYPALQSSPSQWSAFLSPEAFSKGFNALRIVGKSPVDKNPVSKSSVSKNGDWCRLYSNAS